MKKLFAAVMLLVFAVFTLCPNVYADETSESAEDADFDGYIVKTSDVGSATANLMVRAGVIDAVEYVDDTYTTDDLNSIGVLTENDWVEYIEPDYCVQLYDTPNDPYYTSDNDYQWYLDTLSMSYAWENGIDGSGITVGVLDTGLDTYHEDLENLNLSGGWNAIDNNADYSDDSGHGTFVAGIIAAAADNGRGIAGIAPGVNIVSVKCIEDGLLTTTYSVLAAAIAKATASPEEGGFGCDILNMSLGGGEDSITLKNAVEAAVDAGVILIAAAGNSGDGNYSYPASYDGVISVGAVDSDLIKADYSTYNDKVDVVAPGTSICSLQISNYYGYSSWSGTSFSTPMVTAAAALAMSADPDLTSDEFAALLCSTSTDLGIAGRDNYYGYGLLNIGQLLRTLLGDQGISAYEKNDTLYLDAYFSGLASGKTFRLTAASYDDGGRFLGASVINASAGADGVLRIVNDSLPASGDIMKIILLDGNGAPICAFSTISR